MSKKVFLGLSAGFFILLLSGSVLFFYLTGDTETAIVSEKPSLNWEEVNAETKPESIVFESMMDYYANIPEAYLPVSLENRSKSDLTIQDEDNYFLVAHPSAESFEPVTITLFLRDEESPLIALEYMQERDYLYFLEYVDTEWVDVTADYLPDLQEDLSKLNFILPQYGTKITVKGSPNGPLTLAWRNGRFEIESSGDDFTMTIGGAITLEFPQSWSGVTTIDDFSGFSGPDSTAPEYSVSTRVISLWLGEDLLFEVQSLALEDKGHKDIPSRYEYIGESDCRAYYASVSQDPLPSGHEKLKQDVPEILKSFGLDSGPCSDDSF